MLHGRSVKSKVCELSDKNDSQTKERQMSKNIETAILLDTYGSMLTEKQYDTLTLYYDEDLSLSEIAENMGITRQGVHKCIRTSEEYLTQLEETLGFAEKYRKICDICETLTALTDKNVADAPEKEKMKALIEDIKNTL